MTRTDTVQVTVDLGDRSYPIYIGVDLFKEEFLSPHLVGKQVCIVSNTTVAPLYLQKLKNQLSSYEIVEVVLPDGEQFKTLETINTIYDALLKSRFNRQSAIIALGGGVIGDMAGYAAATYLRGINFIQVPTTLLSQVDSSVGGKTGVNHPLGKNMIGAFYQPSCVVIDTDTLSTLEDRELKSGIAEVIKYGLINNAEFFSWLKDNLGGLISRDREVLARAIEVSCTEKAEIVAADEREAGVRAWLNLGHTFGHAIENVMGYGKWLHGEAVATGIVMAADLSRRIGYLSVEEASEVRALVEEAGLPVVPPKGMTAANFWDAMGRDKKNTDGQIRFVLLEKIGKATVQGNLKESLVDQTLVAGDALTR